MAARKRAEKNQAAVAASAEQQAQMLISVTETIMVALAGPGGQMRDAPRLLIGQSLPQVISSYSPEVIAQVGGYLYPGMLGVGILAYVLDVWRAVSAQQMAERAEKEKQSAVLVAKPPQPQAPEQAPSVTMAPAPAVELVIAAGGGNGNGLDDLKSHDGRDYITPPRSF